MEGDVNAGDEHERALAAGLAGTLRRVGRESLKALDGAGNGVLLACQVVVDDLQELAGRLGDTFDVVLHLVVADTELVGTQRSHLVVRSALLVAGNQVVHGGTAVEHELKNGLKFDDTGVG